MKGGATPGRREELTTERQHLIFVGVQPPPLHGQSQTNDVLVAAIRQRAGVTVLDTSPRRLGRNAFYYARKIGRVISCLTVLAVTARARMPCFLSVSSRFGLWLDLCFVLIARSRGCRIFLHHHTYNYIDEQSRAMSILISAAGGSAVHIFACEIMRDQFVGRYRGASRSLICSLAMFGDLATETGRRRARINGPFSIGMLSNLTAQKGLHDFLAIIEACQEWNLPVGGVLAGPAPEKIDREKIEKAEVRSGGRLNYRGPVYGAAKNAFFEEIDAFLLPTRQESYGLVIIEALSRGIPVIAFSRGCIGSYLTAPAGYAVPPDADFAKMALRRITAWINEPEKYLHASDEALLLCGELRRRSEAELARLVTSIVDGEAGMSTGEVPPSGRADAARELPCLACAPKSVR